ncbi:MAG: hypothetical protein AAF578_16000 [Pseudomonadota bacterium]
MILALVALLVLGGIPSALQGMRDRKELMSFFVRQFPRGDQECFLNTSEDWNLIPVRVGREVFHLYSKASAQGVAIFDGVHPPVHIATIPFEIIASADNLAEKKWATLKTTESEEAGIEVRVALKGSVKDAVFRRKRRTLK